MKTIIIYLIRGYQLLPLSAHKMCRYTPTCSEYMIEAINRFGTIKGLKLGIKRILRCRPHQGFGIDEVPEKEELQK